MPFEQAVTFVHVADLEQSERDALRRIASTTGWKPVLRFSQHNRLEAGAPLLPAQPAGSRCSASTRL